jgi:hypothetical protein
MDLRVRTKEREASYNVTINTLLPAQCPLFFCKSSGVKHCWVRSSPSAGTASCCLQAEVQDAFTSKNMVLSSNPTPLRPQKDAFSTEALWVSPAYPCSLTACKYLHVGATPAHTIVPSYDFTPLSPSCNSSDPSPHLPILKDLVQRTPSTGSHRWM